MRSETHPLTATPCSGMDLLGQALAPAAGAPLIRGNQVHILKNAADHYPTWLAAIRAAERTIFFESYILHEDDCGGEFADALAARARAGVRVRLIYDWLGGVGKTSHRFWRRLRAAGVDVRCFNPPRLANPLGWVTRDHRKMLAVDGHVGFVTGLCVGRMWRGDPAHALEPWRDTGVEVRGPAVADIERAFAQVWSAIGDPLPAGELRAPGAVAAAGDVSLRVIASAPGTTGILRVDQLIASVAQRTLWLTDAYFAGLPTYVQALRAAAQDGVDVRLLVPGASDIPLLRPLSQAGYRPLLEAGVRVYEWNGPMMHAKTAVADGQWARVGSSNLNLASWVGNYELDILLEDERMSAAMEQMYLDDLRRATELVLRTSRVRHQPAASARIPGGSASRAAAGAVRLGRTVGATLGTKRSLEPTDTHIVALAGLVLCVLAAIVLQWPMVAALPIAMAIGWAGVGLLIRAYSLWTAR